MKKKAITIEVTDEEVDALEDIFFVKLSEKQREKRYDAKLSLWKKIATAFDYETSDTTTPHSMSKTKGALESFAIKFNRTMEEWAIAGSVSAGDALDELWDSWEENILPLLPVRTSNQKVIK